MRYVTSIERIGMHKGMGKGMESERRMLLRLIHRRFGEAHAEQSAPMLEQIQQPVVFEDLGEALFDCVDEQAWLARINAAAQAQAQADSPLNTGASL